MKTPSPSRQLNCRWELIKGPHNGRTPGTLVWICEYPYRTIRFAPSEDCEGCRRAVDAERRDAFEPAVA